MCDALDFIENRGEKRGEKKGEKNGMGMINRLNRRLLRDGRMEDLTRSIQDRGYQKKLLEEYGFGRCHKLQ